MAKDQSERRWKQLLDLMEERRVIPVVGPELLVLPGAAGGVSLYRQVAEKLLRENNLQAAAGDQPRDGEIGLRRNLELNDAVSELARGGRSQELYGDVKTLLQDALGPNPPIPPALGELAAIPAFDLFVTTTGDDLLRRALVARWGAADEILFAPNLPGHEVSDVPEHRHTAYKAVFYMFGRASALPVYAIHEEDRLEFFYTLQTAQKNVPEVMLSELRSRNLLVIGCALSEWLARFFLRFAGSSRLADGMRKRDFLVDPQIGEAPGLAAFLERFSQNTHVFAQSGPDFVAELARRWRERHPAEDDHPAAARPLATATSASVPDVFISYSRPDLPAAKTLCQELKQLGFGVAWLDKSELKPGDVWEREVERAIRSCRFFLPLISASTEQRGEAYFHKEWDAAAERAKEFLEMAFIFPVVIDPDFDGNAGRYRRVPKKFLEAQFGHAPRGHIGEELAKALTLALRERRRQAGS